MRKTLLTVAVGAAAALTGGAIGFAANAPDQPEREASRASALVAPAAPSSEDGLRSGRTPEDGSTTEDSPTHRATDRATPTHRATGATRISADRAAAIARDRAGGGTVTKIELDFEHGVRVWTVEVVKGSIEYDVDVNAATGTITKVDIKDDDSSGHG
jgi:uncharacterized membrane protein YkoI